MKDNKEKNTLSFVLGALDAEMPAKKSALAARRFVERGKGAMKRLALRYKRLCKNVGHEHHSEDVVWFCSNYYLIEEMFSGAVDALRSRRLYRAIENGSECALLIEALCRELCAENEYLLTVQEITDFFADVSERMRLSSSDIMTVVPVLVLQCVLEMERAFCDGICGRVRDCIRSLFAVRDVMTDELIHLCSYTEKLLLADPSGLYGACDDKTKELYRHRVFEYALKNGIDENRAAKHFLDLAQNGEGREHDIGFHLLGGAKCAEGRGYFLLSGGLALLFSLALFGLLIFYKMNILTAVLICILMAAPAWELSCGISGRIFSGRVKADILPRLSLESVPTDAKTLAIITTLLCSEKNDGEVFDRLEEYYLGNREENVRFGALCDLCDHTDVRCATDEERIDYAKRRIEALNRKYGEHFCLFLRRRSYCAAQKRYMGWERKRGALIELVRLIGGEDTTFSLVECNADFLRDVKYVITLDSDTRLAHSSVRVLVGTMEYPHNRPVIDKEKGIVRSGYGILQPRVTTDVEAARQTRFCVMLTGGGGVDPYSHAAFDLYFHLFSEGNFCGKGIFDVEAFRSVIVDRYPENAVLSHDLLEGTRLRCAITPDIVFTDGIPKNPISFYKRQHRWIRGDVQSLPFAQKNVPAPNGTKVKNPISALSKYKIVDNVRRAATPVCSAAVLALCIFMNNACANAAACFALAWLLWPAAISLAHCAANSRISVWRRYFSDLWPVFIDTLSNFVYSLASLVYVSKVTLDAIIRAVFRMCVTHKGLLDWVTANQADAGQSTGAVTYLREMWVSVVAGVLAVIFGTPIIKILGILWILFPFICSYLSHGLPQKSNINEKQKGDLREYARAMWQYFEDFANEENNYLPPDNFQISPVEELARRTSPTNIGLYLLCCLAARDFEFISSMDLCQRLKNGFETVERLEKWQGHLYNWYSTDTLEILGDPYVSTVDSGNFCLHLEVLLQGLYDYVDEEPGLLGVIGRIRAYLDTVSFAPLYNDKKGLLYLGIRPHDAEAGKHFYDMYMSEARSSGYFAIARGDIPKKHWEKLSRAVLGYRGHIGYASWTGTCFEYFMPALVMPCYEGSAAYESLCFAAKMQMLDSKRIGGVSVFGKSESGYYAFDGEMYYQYQAFGVQRLALKRGMDKDSVFAPYASFLMMQYAPKQMLCNLDALKSLGMHGKYGFYEALDTSPSRVGDGYAVVSSFMAHHIGMSIIACANACHFSSFPERFLKNATLRSASELLKEKIPKDARLFCDVYYSDAASHKRPLLQNFEAGGHVESLANPKCTAISNGKARIVLSSSGHIVLKDGRDILTQSRLFIDSFEHSLAVFANIDGHVVSPLAISQAENNNDSFEFSYSATGARYTVRFTLGKEELTLSLSLALRGAESCYILDASLDGKYEKAELCVFFEPVLMRARDHYSHPAFSKLSISAEFDEKDSVLTFSRRPRLDNEAWRNMSIASSEGILGFDTRMDSCLPLMYDREDIAALCRAENKNEVGACINPFCALRCDLTRGAATIAIGYSSDKTEAKATVKKALRAEDAPDDALLRAQVSLWNSARNMMYMSGFDVSHSEFCETVQSALVFPDLYRKPPEGQDCFPREALWEYGISGDHAIISVDLSECTSPRGTLGELRRILSVYKYLTLKGERFDLVFIYREKERYFEPIRRMLESLISEMGLMHFLGHSRGIFLIDIQAAKRDVCTLIRMLSVLYVPVLSGFSISAFLGSLDANAKQARGPRRIKRRKAEFPVCSDDCVRADSQKVCIKKGTQKSPFSFVYASPVFGTLVTQNSLGFTWVENSREKKLTPWSNDALLDCNGERLLLKLSDDGEKYDLCALSDIVTYYPDRAVYDGNIEGISYSVCVGIDTEQKIKTVSVNLQSLEDMPDAVSVFYAVYPIMGVDINDACSVLISEKNRELHFKNRFGSALCGESAYLCSGGDGEGGTLLQGGELGRYAAVERRLSLYADRRYELNFAFGVYKSEKEYALGKDAFLADAHFANKRYKAQTERELSAFELKSSDAALDAMFNFFVPYQMLHGRIYARCGFYQVSGAYGFRDQLQDAMAAVYLKPGLTKSIILRAAAHQYWEGDVQHWWHNLPSPRTWGHMGIRSRCSDDYLWLPYAVAHYINKTGDLGILDIRVPYIESAPLSRSETERYERPRVSADKESLYMHCIRAIEHGMRFGRHGLPLIGSCDWNDGFSRVGIEGKGESVWLGWFLICVVRDFIPVCILRGDLDGKEKYEQLIKDLYASLEKHAFEGEWYLRAFFDDGEKLGADSCDECKIDLIPQAFAVMSALPSPKKCKAALDAAYDRLYDEKNALMRLFWPAFVNGEKDPGYIKGYVEGIRENGGQYTHAANWAAYAYLLLGENSRGYELIRMINPLWRLEDKEKLERYRIEPYVIAGDVYSNPEHMGRGGWSWYTGAAGWFYRTVLEQLLGYCELGEVFTLRPRLCAAFSHYSLTVRKRGSVYRINVSVGSEFGAEIDGIALPDICSERSMRFRFDGGEHTVNITCPLSL